MDATVFWQIIGEYNSTTWLIQTVLFLLLGGGVALSYLTHRGWICKVALAVMNLFIAFGFFHTYGTEPIQKYFAFPLYLGIGVLLLYDAYKNCNEQLRCPSIWQWIFIGLYLIYPLVSLACGHSYPQLVTYIMPCPVVTISIALYAGYRKRNPLLLIFLALWGLTGIKAIIFHAWEDLILLGAGFYAIALIINSLKKA